MSRKIGAGSRLRLFYFDFISLIASWGLLNFGCFFSAAITIQAVSHENFGVTRAKKYSPSAYQAANHFGRGRSLAVFLASSLGYFGLAPYFLRDVQAGFAVNFGVNKPFETPDLMATLLGNLRFGYLRGSDFLGQFVWLARFRE